MVRPRKTVSGERRWTVQSSADTQAWASRKKAEETKTFALPAQIPADEQAELALIGCCVLGGYERAIQAGVSEDLFYHEVPRKAWKALGTLSEASMEINEVTMVQEVKMGALWVHNATESAPSASNVDYWVPKLKDVAVRRRIWSRYYDGISRVTDPGIDTPDLLREMEKNFFDVTTNASTLRSQKDGWREVLDGMGKAWPNGSPVTGIRTGLPSLDKVIKGFEGGSLNIIAARPKRGKTSFALWLAVQAARQGKKVVYWSFEMPFAQIAKKLISADSGLDVADYMETGNVPGGIETMVNATKKAMELPITIEDNVGLTITAIRSQARRYVKEKGIDLFIVDYLQLVNSGKRYESRTNEVSVLSRQLKMAAMETNTPFVVLSQLNRSIETRGPNAEPRLADLRESGSIEQDADMVGFLHQPDPETLPDLTQLMVKANRHGPEGKVSLQWTKYCGQFTQFDGEIETKTPPF